MWVFVMLQGILPFCVEGTCRSARGLLGPGRNQATPQHFQATGNHYTFLRNNPKGSLIMQFVNACCPNSFSQIRTILRDPPICSTYVLVYDYHRSHSFSIFLFLYALIAKPIVNLRIRGLTPQSTHTSVS